MDIQDLVNHQKILLLALADFFYKHRILEQNKAADQELQYPLDLKLNINYPILHITQ